MADSPNRKDQINQAVHGAITFYNLVLNKSYSRVNISWIEGTHLETRKIPHHSSMI